ncbi:MAG TPA: hypothetical protein VK923_00730 [Euzebyales bacterium]|nr:hypothetical protein [Euzebyales bacterium]
MARTQVADRVVVTGLGQHDADACQGGLEQARRDVSGRQGRLEGDEVVDLDHAGV